MSELCMCDFLNLNGYRHLDIRTYGFVFSLWRCITNEKNPY
jgi:hypothetical protein